MLDAGTKQGLGKLSFKASVKFALCLDFTLWYSTSSREASSYSFKMISSSSSGSFLYY